MSEIPAEAIQAAAKARHDAKQYAGRLTHCWASCLVQEQYLSEAEDSVAPAAPAIRRAALEEAAAVVGSHAAGASFDRHCVGRFLYVRQIESLLRELGEQE